MKLNVTELSSRDELERLYKPILTRFDWYFVSELKYIKNGNVRDVFYLKKEKIFCIVSGKDLKHSVEKKARRKNNEFLFADKPDEPKKR